MSNRRNIIKAAGVVSVATFAMYAVSFLREAVIGFRFGVSADLDALLVAYAVPMFLASTLSSVLQGVIIPLYLEIVDPLLRHEFLNKVYTFLVGILGGLMFFLVVSTPWLVGIVGNGLGASQQNLTIKLIWVMVLFVPGYALSGFSATLLFAERVFWWPSVLPAVASAVTIVCVWLGGARWGVYSLAVGITLGAATQLVFAQWILARHGIRLHLVRDWQDARLRKLVQLSLPLFIGSLSTGLTVLIDRGMASFLPVGSISALGYAEKINGMAVMALGSLQTAVFPFFAEQAGAGNKDQLATDFVQTITLIIFILAPVSLLMIFFNRPLVEFLFQRGAFDAAASARTSKALVGFAIGLVPVGIGFICVRMAQAVQSGKLIGFVGLLNPIFKVLFNLVLIPIFGVLGVSLATTGMYTVGAAILLAGLARIVKEKIITPATFVPIAKIGVALLAMGGALWILERWFHFSDGNQLIVLGSILFNMFVGVSVYAIVCFLLGLEEMRRIIEVTGKVFLWSTK